MPVDRLKYRLHSTNSQTSVNTDTFLNVKLEGNERLLPLNNINEVVDTAEVFNKERQSCTKYRLIGTIKPIMTNVLFNLDGPNSWATFDEDRFKDDPYGDNFISPANDAGRLPLTYEESYAKHLKEQDGWFGFYNPEIVTSGACDFTTMEPQKRRFSFYPDPVIGKNWELTITYPWSADTNHFLVSGATAGLKIIGVSPSDVGGRQMAMFSTATAHNLVQGDRVRLVGLNPSTYDGDYRVARVGQDNGDNQQYYFSVQIPISQISGGTLTDTRLRRLVNGEESQYYIRLFKKVRTVNTNINNGVIEDDDYETYPAAFSQTIFKDEVPQFVVNEDIEVKDLTDNLGRPLSELFVTVIKTQANFFTDTQCGLELGLVDGIFDWGDDIPDVKRMHDGVSTPFLSPVPLRANTLITDDYFHGDVVEYNRFEQIEHVLSVAAHRFNTENRVLSATTAQGLERPRQEGYWYYPHRRIRIRDYSNYIEQGDVNTFGIPDYAEDLGDGRWLWRDLLDIGINDGQFVTLNYPFLNGSHYLYHNYCFPLRRQDPYGQYDLYFGPSSGNAPYDVVGAGITDRFQQKSEDAAC